MSVTMTLKFKNIKGESSVKAPEAKESFDILSWNWGMSQSATAHVAKGAAQGSADVRDLTFTKIVDKASPTIISDCFGGVDQVEATLYMFKTANSKTYQYVSIAMTGIVFISSYHTGDIGPNDQLLETITLNFANVKVTFTPPKPNGDADATVESKPMAIAEKC
jgi:type VI secretion system secreted protein Hcp